MLNFKWQIPTSKEGNLGRGGQLIAPDTVLQHEKEQVNDWDQCREMRSKEIGRRRTQTKEISFGKNLWHLPEDSQSIEGQDFLHFPAKGSSNLIV